jgi:hypothetical protein
MKGKKTGGRQKGSKNKVTLVLKEAILKAAENAGGEEGTVGYLRQQAILNPGPFLGLLGKLLPKTHAGERDNPIKQHGTIEWVVRRPPNRDE